MSINRILTGYYQTGYTNTNTVKGVMNNSFADTFTEKAVTDKIDYDEIAFECCAHYAPDEVKKAWMEAAKETGANGMGIGSNGMMTHLSAMHVRMITNNIKRGYWEGGRVTDLPDCDILGSTVESALWAAKEALYDLEHPLDTSGRGYKVQQCILKEKAFYKSFIEKLEHINDSTKEADSSYIRTSYKTSSVEAYFASYTYSIRNGKETYETYQSDNYKIVPDNEAGCFDIYNKQGERLGAFSYSDIVIGQDAVTGKQFLISEHGTMSYDALVIDDELKNALKNIMGKDELETEQLKGYTLQTHPETGIQYLLREGEEGRGGKVLLQTEEDIAKYEALAETYFNKYPNLIKDKKAAYIWADLEIKGMAKRAEQGLISMGYDGMSYNDNLDYQNNWSVVFGKGTYEALYEYIRNNPMGISEMQKFNVWQDILDTLGSSYARIW